MLAVYSSGDAVEAFFQDLEGSSKQACDDRAASLVGEPVHPVSIQGQFSYTVIAGPQQDKIVQFRPHSFVLDTKVLQLAAKIHGVSVPACNEHEELGNLRVYVMDKVQGIAYIEARQAYGTLKDPGSQRTNTVLGLARFVQKLDFTSQTDLYIVSLPNHGNARKLIPSAWLQRM